MSWCVTFSISRSYISSHKKRSSISTSWRCFDIKTHDFVNLNIYHLDLLEVLRIVRCTCIRSQGSVCTVIHARKKLKRRTKHYAKRMHLDEYSSWCNNNVILLANKQKISCGPTHGTCTLKLSKHSDNSAQRIDQIIQQDQISTMNTLMLSTHKHNYLVEATTLFINEVTLPDQIKIRWLSTLLSYDTGMGCVSVQ